MNSSNLKETPPAVPRARTRALRVLTWALAMVTGAAMLLLMLATAADVVSRKFGASGIAGVVEWTEVLLVILVFAGMMGAERNGAHIRGASFLTDRKHSVAAPLARCIGSALSVLILVWAAYATGEEAVSSVQLGEFRMGLIQVPIWPSKVAITVGLAAFALVMAIRASEQFNEGCREVARRRREERSSLKQRRPQ